MRVKICGITDPGQGRAIAALGASALGFICVRKSPRYVAPERIRSIGRELPASIGRIGVFANATPVEIVATVRVSNLTGVQLHGDETPADCQQLQALLPGVELLKAFRVRDRQTLDTIPPYQDCVDTVLLDAFDPTQLGGTGHTLDWKALVDFRPPLPWLLAGGLNPENVGMAIENLSPNRPNGIDLSSGIERSPGDKDLERAAVLFATLAKLETTR
ncbi:MAG: phosphoribosylanthranilate isomerase [Cyanobacteria bacterium J06641_5]